jgi:hypothetical protein
LTNKIVTIVADLVEEVTIKLAVTLKPPVKTPSAIYPDQDTHGWTANLIQRID